MSRCSDNKDRVIMDLRKRLRQAENDRDKALTLLCRSDVSTSPHNLIFYRKFISIDYIASWLGLPKAFHVDNIIADKDRDMIEEALQHSFIPGGIHWPMIDNEPLRLGSVYWLRINDEDYTVRVVSVSLRSGDKEAVCSCTNVMDDKHLGWYPYSKLRSITAYEMSIMPIHEVLAESWGAVDGIAAKYGISLDDVHDLPDAITKLMSAITAKNYSGDINLNTDNACTCGEHCGCCKNSSDAAPQGPTVK